MRKKTSPKITPNQPTHDTTQKPMIPLSPDEKKLAEMMAPGGPGLDYNWLISRAFSKRLNRSRRSLEGPSLNPNREFFEVGQTYDHGGCCGNVDCTKRVYVIEHIKEDIFFVDYYDGERFYMLTMPLGAEWKFERDDYKDIKHALDGWIASGGVYDGEV